MRSTLSIFSGVQGIFSALIAMTLILVCILAVSRPQTSYLYMFIETPENIGLSVLIDRRERAAKCQAATGGVAATILTSCPSCRIVELQCVTDLTLAQQAALSTGPLETVSAAVPDGVIVFNASNIATSMEVCEKGQLLAGDTGAQITCFPPNTLRLQTDLGTKANKVEMIWAALALVVASLAAWFTSWLIVRYEYLHACFSFDPVGSGPQKFHSIPTARIGGIAVVAGLLAGSGVILLLDSRFSFKAENLGYLLIASVPVFLVGLLEDVTKKVRIVPRLLLTLLGASLGALFLGATLNRLDIHGVDSALLWLPFAVCGVTNAINIIDGYNGLAGGLAVIALAAMAFVSAQVGDEFIFFTALVLIGALLGFLTWNWPSGKLFLGDGGAYLIGFILAELSVLLVVRNPAVSPWFPMMLLSYPVIETIFSIYRKKILKRISPGSPGSRHLHMLVYKFLILPRFGSTAAQNQVFCNSLVALYVLWAPLACSLFAIVFWQESSILATAFGFVSLAYVYIYWRIAFLEGPEMRPFGKPDPMSPVLQRSDVIAKTPQE